MTRGIAVALAVLAGCYEPAVETCAIGCDLEGGVSCPGGLVCGSDFHCHAPGDEETCTFAVEVDFQNPDALSAAKVIGEGIDCPGDCTVDVLGGSELVVEAQPGTDPVFVEFSSCLGDGRNRCTTRVVRPTVIDARLSPGRLLQVEFGGDGVGRIVSTPGGIDCRGPGEPGCEAVFGVDEEVTLQAIPEDPTRFLGFVFVCANSDAETCVIPPGSELVQVGAVFDVLRLSILAVGQGQGGDSITIQQTAPTPRTFPPCTGSCSLLFDPDTQPSLALEAIAGQDRRFREWFGVAPACGRSKNCNLTQMSSDTLAVAAFDALKQVNVTAVQGRLTIVGEDATFECPTPPATSGVCSRVFRLGEQLTIAPTTPTPRFVSWSSSSGVCPADPLAPCAFTVATDTFVTGTFRQPTLELGKLPGDGISEIEIHVDGNQQPSCGPFNGTGDHFCTVSFPLDSLVEMKAVTGTWVECGASVGTPLCTLTLTDDAAATASF